MLALALDFSTVNAYLQRPDILFTNLLYWFGWIPILGVMIWGFFEVWIDKRQDHYRDSRQYVMLAIDVPKETEQSPRSVENLFAAIAAAWGGPNFKEKWLDGEVAPVFSFELVSLGGYIQFFVRCEKRFRDMVEAGIYSAYPDAEISEADDYTIGTPDKFPDETYNCWGTEQKLKYPDYLPLRTYEDFEHKMSQELKDPLGLTLEQYGRLKPGEQVWTQIILQPLGPLAGSWTKPGIKFIYESVGKEVAHKKKSFTSEIAAGFQWIPGEIANQLGGLLSGGAEEHKQEDPWKFFKVTAYDKAKLERVSMKLTKPGMHVKIRHVYLSTHEAWNKKSRDKMIQAVFNQYSQLDGNQFGRVSRVTPKTDYFWQKWYENTRKGAVIRAYKKRNAVRGGTAFILNTEELATLWHFPAIIVKAPYVSKTVAKRAEPPVQLPLEEEMTDMVAMAAEKRAAPTALPIDLVEPVMPGKSAAPTPPSPPPAAPSHSTPEPAHTPAPAPSSELSVAPKMPKMPAPPAPSAPKPAPVKPPQQLSNSATQPPAPAIPDAVRFLFDPSVSLEDAGLKGTEDPTPDAPGNIPIEK